MSALLIRLFIKDRDNVKDKNVRKKYGYLGSCTGIVLNIMLFLGKLIAGFVSGLCPLWRTLLTTFLMQVRL